MQLLIGEYAFFVNESKLETFNKPETFQWYRYSTFHI